MCFVATRCSSWRPREFIRLCIWRSRGLAEGWLVLGSEIKKNHEFLLEEAEFEICESKCLLSNFKSVESYCTQFLISQILREINFGL